MAIANSATGVLKAFIDREVARALRQLRIRSFAALRRELREYEEHCIFDGGFGDVRSDITARLEAIELIASLAGDGLTSPLDTSDDWICELRALLPTALKRPLTKEERAEVFAKVDAAQAKRAENQERRWVEWERSAEGKKLLRAIARRTRRLRAA
ncbi:MAG TPA: hypothetical protein VL393_06125 [Candidatus Binataceae bacterium]|jgi:hypothetical protein|nr:hypothetical protein [Candidatus Binataceae bacterium]